MSKDQWQGFIKRDIGGGLLLLLVLVCAFWPRTGLAADEYYKAFISTNTPNLGDSLVYSIEVMTSGETQYSPDITPPDLGKFFQVGETVGRSSVNILNGRTYIVNFKEVQLVANRTGEIVIPPATIELIDPKNNQRVTKQTNSLALKVEEATGAAAIPTPTPEIDVLRPIKKSAVLTLSQWLPFGIGGGIIISIFGVMLYLKYRPAPKPKVVVVPQDPRTPEERAFSALEKAMKLKEEGKIGDFYTELSSILRHYMSETFQFKAEEATTREMIAEMERLEFFPEFLKEYRAYFLECDKVKFANARPDQPKVDLALPKVKELIAAPNKRRVPEPPPVEPAADASASSEVVPAASEPVPKEKPAKKK